ncbi:MAG: NTP transferase domain-containing protein [Candidatus Latescibacterota bacterium]|nr:MAG: NTP transferase domain-containing protein [Candidatus Latescibacterota bacterium]
MSRGLRSPRRLSSLARALALGRGGVHAFVGAGGKSAAIRRLLRERPEAIATTTTHLAASGFGRGLLAVFPDAQALARLQPRLRSRPLTLARRADSNRLRSPPLDWFTRVKRDALLLVEADGAAGALVKRPGPHEPAWPPAAIARAVIVVGLAAVGEPVARVSHHPERFGSRRDATVDLEMVEQMLRDYLGAAPPHAALTVLLTGAERVAPQAVERLVAWCERRVRKRSPQLQSPSVPLRIVAVDDVARGACTTWEREAPAASPAARLPGVTGVLLAAGIGRRFGAPGAKLLARWRGRSLVEHAVERWSRADPAELLVVVGCAAEEVEARVRRAARGRARALRLVRNRGFARGLGTSVRAAVRAASPGTALLFGHADMPAVSVATLQRIADVGSTLRTWIVQPTVDGVPRNPVYFPAELRRELARVPDAAGGRVVCKAHAERLLRLEFAAAELVDVDRPDDLELLSRGRERGGEGCAARRSRE